MAAYKAEKNELEQARIKLHGCKKKIKDEQKELEVKDSVAGILNASDKKDWQRIKHFKGNVSSLRQMLKSAKPLMQRPTNKLFHPPR